MKNVHTSVQICSDTGKGTGPEYDVRLGHLQHVLADDPAGRHRGRDTVVLVTGRKRIIENERGLK